MKNIIFSLITHLSIQTEFEGEKVYCWKPKIKVAYTKL